MTWTFTRDIPNILFSVVRFLSNTQYTVGVTTGTILDHFTGLKIQRAYPDDLVALATPTLAVCAATMVNRGVEVFGPGINEDEFAIEIYGFVVKQGRDVQNQLYRDRLLNDTYQLLSRAGQEEGVPLFEQAGKTLAGSIEVSRAIARLLPANAPEVEAERHKFVIELSVLHTD